ncbi:MAG: HAD hydrolase family protein [bacterium]|nr:MAG: HAD hydrolase family protein [bacterium]
MRIQLIAFDVDGVLTDGKIHYTSQGHEIKSFHVRDGHAMKLAQRAGLQVALITGRRSDMVAVRAEELGISHVYQGVKEKVVALGELLATTGLEPDQICYLGDDVVDIPLIRRVGLGCAVADAPEEVRQAADLITDASGGMGAGREVIVLILKAKGLWDGVMERYLV